MREVMASARLELQVIVTGMHLSPEYGLTYEEIEKDGFVVDRKLEMLLSADTPSAIAKSTGLGLINFADAFAQLRPDIVVIVGDRFEVLAASIAALFARVPIAHLHGGETTEGAFDEAVRHAITKMSHLHFTATEEYRRRVIQLGEHPDRVFNVGGLGVDNITKLNLHDRETLEQSIGLKLGRRNLLVTYHPVTLEEMTAAGQFAELLAALDTLTETRIIFTKPNADPGGRIIIRMIDEYVARNPDMAVAFTSLGHLQYLSTLQYVDGVVGNSSSGLLEAPSFRIGTVNIGDRQKGRVRAASVIDCAPVKDAICTALETLYSARFQRTLRSVKNPYGEGGAAAKISSILEQTPLINIVKKSFYDLDAGIYHAGSRNAAAGCGGDGN